MQQVDRIAQGKAAVVLDHAFWASMLMNQRIVEDNSIPTLAVDSRGKIYYNKEFVEGLPIQQVVFGLCHEIGHIMGKHAIRRGSRDAKRWNYAGDAWINDMLRECGVGEPIPNTVNISGSKDKTIEQIYDELPDDGGGGGGDQSGGNAGGQGQDPYDNGLGDDIIEVELTESERDEIEANIKVQIAQAAQAAKMRGQLGGKLADIVADILYSPTPWYEILERYMTDKVKQDLSWTRPNRRYADTYLPSLAKNPAMGEVVIQVDISGSISQQETAYYNGHLSRILTQCNPTRVHLLYTDTDVQKYEVFEQGEEFKITHFSGGGTYMPAGFDFVAEQGIDPDVFICLTDGYTDFGDQQSYPIVWTISSDLTAPHGDTIHFEMEN
jgi:predicted metal-dependent peptidase